MKPIWVAGACLLACCAVARASSYNDFVSGLGMMDVAPERAVQYFTAALADPGLLPSLRPVALFDRARLYARSGEDDKAAADLDAALALRPDFDTYTARGSLRLARGDADAAVSDFAAAIALRPDRSAGYELREGALIDQGKFDAAVADAQKAVDVSPDNIATLIKLSAAHRLQGDSDAALADAEKFLTLTQRFSPAGYVARALVYEDKGDFDRALSEIGFATRLSPDATEVLLIRVRLKWEAGRFSEAAADAQKTADTDPTNSVAVLWLALTRGDAKADKGDIDARAAKLDVTEWPGALVKLYQGQATTAEVMTQAHTNALTRRAFMCDANFYGAQYARLQGRVAEAGQLLDAAATNCSPGNEEHRMATRQTAAGGVK